MSYAIWHQPEYGAGLRSPDRAHDRYRTSRPRRRGPRITILTLVAGLSGLGATDALTASGPTTTWSAPADRMAHTPGPLSTSGDSAWKGSTPWPGRASPRERVR